MGVNRLVTRGMGRNYQQPGNSGMITAGMGGFFQQIIDEYVAPLARRIVKTGRSARDSALREFNNVVIWAKLVFINDAEPKALIAGSSSSYTIRQHGAHVELVSSKVLTKSDYVVSAKRIVSSDGNH